MAQLWWRSIFDPLNKSKEVDESHPLPVRQVPLEPEPTLLQVPFRGDFLWYLAKRGSLYFANDADENDFVTGQTSFADTSPTFMLRVPGGVTCLPLFINLAQTGTVAGAVIDVIIAADFRVDRYSSGTLERTLRSKRTGPVNVCKLYSTVTASASSGDGTARLWMATIGQDVSPAEGAVQGPYWKPEVPYLLEGPASLLVYTYAGTTGPTWAWSFGWGEWPTAEGLAG